MTGPEFSSALRGMGLRQKWLAKQLGVTEHTVSRWARGGHPVPPYVPFLLELLRELGGSHSGKPSTGARKVMPPKRALRA